jgi:hypothetical protein
MYGEEVEAQVVGSEAEGLCRRRRVQRKSDCDKRSRMPGCEARRGNRNTLVSGKS